MMEVKYTDNLLVYVEVEPTGKMATVSAELLTKGRALAEQLGCQLQAVAIGSSVQHVAEEAFAYGVDVFHVCEDSRLTAYTTAPYAKLLTDVINLTKPQIVLLGSTAVGRDLAPRVAAILQTGLTANCIDLQIDKENNSLLQIRPAFGDNLMATIVTPHSKPQMATVRAGVFHATPLTKAVAGEVAIYNTANVLTDADFGVKVLEQRLLSVQNNIEQAQVVIAGGYGVGSQKNFDLLRKLASLLHGEVGGTRAAVDAGWISHDEMIGQTGITVRPKLYIACGISGQVQHITGMQDSDIIVSINTDADAPINKIADYVITGSVEEVLPVLIHTIESRKK
jgi:electron transfer flavoprotein alpha subunit